MCFERSLHVRHSCRTACGEEPAVESANTFSSSNANTFRSSNVNVQQQFKRQRSPHSQSCNASCSKTSIGSSAFARQYRFDRSSTLHVLLSCSPHHRTLKPQGFHCSAPAGASACLPGFTRLRARGFAASFAETAALHCASAA